MIYPTVSRKVWYRPSKSDATGPKPMAFMADQPLDATVVAVYGERMVSVLVKDIYGRTFPVLSVTLVQEGDPKPEDGRYVEWMPYQNGQAKKAEVAA